METHRDLRTIIDRRRIERRQIVPDSLKPFLGWMIPEERRTNERRREERRHVAFSFYN
jgi:hypothetical protein